MLTAINFAYRDHLLNFKCNLERVGMQDHLVIAALDTKVYEWGVRQGLPIYLSSTVQAHSGTVVEGGAFGDTGFRKLTKMKSAEVLAVLEAGYSIVWSDVDITWFEHPFEALAVPMSKNDTISIQSNAPYLANASLPALPHESVDMVERSDAPAPHTNV
jgi:hypothetical protein